MFTKPHKKEKLKVNPVERLIHPDFGVMRRAEGDYLAWRNEPEIALLCPDQLNASFKGKSAVILASGPSINDMPLGAFTSAAFIVVNGAIKKCQEFDIKPTVYICNDHKVAEREYSTMLEGVQQSEMCLLSPAAASRLLEHDMDVAKRSKIALLERVGQRLGFPYLNGRALLRFMRKDDDFVCEEPWCLPWQKRKAVGFSTNMRKGLVEARTVTYFALQAAVCLGFEKIFIAGMDLTAGGGVRFYQEKNPLPSTYLGDDFDKFIKPSFALVSKLAERGQHCDVYNLSAVSRLPTHIIPKITAEKALQMIGSDSDD